MVKSILVTLPHTEIQDRINGMVWSFSRLRAYESCPEMFYRTYILHQPQRDNAFAQYGTFAHSIYERFLRGELFSFECGTVFRKEFALYVNEDFPSFGGKDLGESWFDAGEMAFDSVEDLPDCYEVVGVEMKVESSLPCGDRLLPFKGFIDLLLRDKRDGKYIIVDHKSHARFKSAREKREYARQLYLYAEILVQSGVVRARDIRLLAFNMFRAGYVEKIDYNPDHALEALAWAGEMVQKIFDDPAFTQVTLRDKKYSLPMFCTEICSFRGECTPELCEKPIQPKGSDLKRKSNESSSKKPMKKSMKIFRSASPTSCIWKGMTSVV